MILKPVPPLNSMSEEKFINTVFEYSRYLNVDRLIEKQMQS